MISKIGPSNVRFGSRVDIFRKAKKIMTRMQPEEALSNGVMHNFAKYINRLNVENLTEEERILRAKINAIRYSYSKIVHDNLTKKTLAEGVSVDKANIALKKYEEVRQLIIDGAQPNIRRLEKTEKYL